MPTPAIGQIGLVMENQSAPGLVQLLAPTAIGATMSLTNQPTGSTGMKLLIYVYGNTATGTLSIAGKDINGNAQTETCQAIAVPSVSTQSSFVTKYEYETAKSFSSVNASGITTTGATNGTIVIYGVQTAKYMIPATLKAKAKYDKYSPNEHRNLLGKNTRSMQLVKKVAIDELMSMIYPKDSLWLAYVVSGSAPTVTTLPASPTSLLAATAVAGSPLSLTTQPTNPGMALIVVITGSSAVGTIGLAGTDVNGNAISETITTAAGGSNGNGTYYSANVYKTVNASGVTNTGNTSGSVAITGVYGWQYVFTANETGAYYSMCLEMFDGVESFSLPWSYMDDIVLELGSEKEMKVTAKGLAQDRLVIGDRTTNPLNVSRVTSLGQPSDLPLMGWQTNVYIDATVGAVPTTVFADMLDLKINFKNPAKPGWTLTNTQNFNRINRQKYEVALEATLDVTNVLQLEQYRLNLIQYITFQFLGRNLGGGNQSTWQFTFPMRYDDFETESTPEGDHVIGKVKMTPEYDSGLGSTYKITVISQQSPTYLS